MNPQQPVSCPAAPRPCGIHSPAGCRAELRNQRCLPRSCAHTWYLPHYPSLPGLPCLIYPSDLQPRPAWIAVHSTAGPGRAACIFAGSFSIQVRIQEEPEEAVAPSQGPHCRQSHPSWLHFLALQTPPSRGHYTRLLSFPRWL